MSSSTLVPGAAAPSQGFDASASASSAPQYGSVYVGDLNPDILEKDLLEIFKSCGNIRSVRIPRDITTGNSLCYGYVNFDTLEAANKAVTEFNGIRIRGKKPCRVMHQEHDSSKRNSVEGKIFVKGLKHEVDTRALQGYMSQFGDIYSCVVKTDPEGNSLGYGFCQFQNDADAKKALESADASKPALGPDSCIVKFLPPSERASSRDRFTNVYVKGFDRDAKEDVVKGLFADCGEITSWFFAREGDSVEEDPQNARLKGFCFANFKNHEDAVKVIEKFGENKKIAWVDGVPQSDEETAKIIAENPSGYPKGVFVGTLVVCRAMSKEERKKLLEKDHPKTFPGVEQGRCIYIKGISPEMNEDDLVEAFKKFGELETIVAGEKEKPNVHIPRNKENGGSVRGFAYVTFKSEESCRKACDAGDVVVKDKRLMIYLAQSKNRRMAAGMQIPFPQGQFGMPLMSFPFMFTPRGFPFMFAPSSAMMGSAGSSMMGPRNGNGNFVGTKGLYQGFPYDQKPSHSNGMSRGGSRNRSNGGNGGNRNGRSKPSGRGNQNYPKSHKAAVEASRKAEEVTSMPAVVPEPAPVAAPAEPEPQEVAESPVDDIKQRLGERIYERVMEMFEDDEPRWGKLTGMLIESINTDELQNIVEDEEKLKAKILEANRFYEEHVSRAAAESAQQ